MSFSKACILNHLSGYSADEGVGVSKSEWGQSWEEATAAVQMRGDGGLDQEGQWGRRKVEGFGR